MRPMETWKQTGNRGFTLVELLVVMSIIMILVGIAIPTLNGVKEKARNAEVKAAVHDIQTALAQYGVDHNGFYPGMNWVFDANGALWNGPGLRGGIPMGATQDEQKFYVPRMGDPARYLPDGETPDPEKVDPLARDGYMPEYPANPFLRTGGSAQRQVTNLFYFGVDEQNGPDLADPDYLQWSYLAYNEGVPVRQAYVQYARGHFTYIPLNPVNTQGYDFENMWADLTLEQRAKYYEHVRSFLLIGWGSSRMDDTQAKGLSNKWWDSAEGGFDLDQSMTIDPIESRIVGLIRPHMLDSSGGYGGFGEVDITGHANIDSGFYGATIILSSGN